MVWCGCVVVCGLVCSLVCGGVWSGVGAWWGVVWCGCVVGRGLVCVVGCDLVWGCGGVWSGVGVHLSASSCVQDALYADYFTLIVETRSGQVRSSQESYFSWEKPLAQ